MEAKTKKLIISLGIGAVAITLSILAWNKWGRKPKKTEEEDKADQENKKAEAKAENKPYVAPQPTDTFPLEHGKRGNNVKALQEALMKRFSMKLTSDGKPTDFFGQKTEDSVKFIGYKVPLSEADYKRILDGKYAPSTASTSTTTQSDYGKFKTGKALWAKKSGVVVNTKSGSNWATFSDTTKKDELLGTITDRITEMAGTKDERAYIVFKKDDSNNQYRIYEDAVYVLS